MDVKIPNCWALNVSVTHQVFFSKMRDIWILFIIFSSSMSMRTIERKIDYEKDFSANQEKLKKQ